MRAGHNDDEERETWWEQVFKTGFVMFLCMQAFIKVSVFRGEKTTKRKEESKSENVKTGQGVKEL